MSVSADQVCMEKRLNVILLFLLSLGLMACTSKVEHSRGSALHGDSAPVVVHDPGPDGEPATLEDWNPELVRFECAESHQGHCDGSVGLLLRVSLTPHEGREVLIAHRCQAFRAFDSQTVLTNHHCLPDQVKGSTRITPLNNNDRFRLYYHHPGGEFFEVSHLINTDSLINESETRDYAILRLNRESQAPTVTLNRTGYQPGQRFVIPAIERVVHSQTKGLPELVLRVKRHCIAQESAIRSYSEGQTDYFYQVRHDPRQEVFPTLGCEIFDGSSGAPVISQGRVHGMIQYSYLNQSSTGETGLFELIGRVVERIRADFPGFRVEPEGLQNGLAFATNMTCVPAATAAFSEYPGSCRKNRPNLRVSLNGEALQRRAPIETSSSLAMIAVVKEQDYLSERAFRYRMNYRMLPQQDNVLMGTALPECYFPEHQTWQDLRASRVHYATIPVTLSQLTLSRNLLLGHHTVSFEPERVEWRFQGPNVDGVISVDWQTRDGDELEQQLSPCGRVPESRDSFSLPEHSNDHVS